MSESPTYVIHVDRETHALISVLSTLHGQDSAADMVKRLALDAAERFPSTLRGTMAFLRARRDTETAAHFFEVPASSPASRRIEERAKRAASEAIRTEVVKKARRPNPGRNPESEASPVRIRSRARPLKAA